MKHTGQSQALSFCVCLLVALGKADRVEDPTHGVPHRVQELLFGHRLPPTAPRRGSATIEAVDRRLEAVGSEGTMQDPEARLLPTVFGLQFSA